MKSTEMASRIVSFKDLTCKKDISVNGTGKFYIGLALDGNLVVEDEEEALAVSLLHVEVQENGGCTLSPANKDLACVVNSVEQLAGEINLINGTRLEIADKTLVFIDGPIPKLRRKLPRTPGMALGDAAPAKPARNAAPAQDPPEPTETSHHATSVNPAPEEDLPEDLERNEDQRWLESSWCMLELPVLDQEMFQGLDTPEKVGILAASYLCKQIRIFTDASVTTKRLDDIFKMCLDTVDQCMDVYMNYLSDISKLLARVPDHSNTQPMHSPAIRFLAQLLTRSLDPVVRVVMILDLLRTFSHFDANLSTLVRYGTTAAVLGSMAAFLDIVEVQQYAMDILAKIATYSPRLDKKEPLRDVGIDLVVRGMLHHSKNIALARAGCRVLANLSSTLLTVTNQLLDSGEPSDVELVTGALDRYETLLLYVFENGIPAVQSVLKEFRTDLGVSTEGRRFIFYYAKLPQLQLKKSKWRKVGVVSSPAADGNEASDKPVSEVDDLEKSSENELEESVDPSVDQSKILRKASLPEPEVVGILKNTRCYENRRNSDKRIVFADDTVGGSDSESYTSESEAELAKSLEASIELDPETSNKFSTKVRHVMKRTIKRQKSFRGEVDMTESDTEEDSFTEDAIAHENENRDVQQEDTHDTGKSDSEAKESIGSNNDTVPAESAQKSTDNKKPIPSKRGKLTEAVASDTLISAKPLVKARPYTDPVYRTISIDQDYVLIESADEKTDENKSLNNQSSNGASSLSDGGSLGQSITRSDDDRESHETTDDTETLQKLQASTEVEKPPGGSLDQSITRSDDGRESQETTDETETLQKLQASTEVEKPPIQHEVNEAIPVKGISDRPDVVIDVYFFGRLVRTQIIVYVGSLVFQGEDSKVLLIIDQPIKPLLEEAGAPADLVNFAGSQYGPEMTLMDLEPAIVINIIDAVRYRSVTKDLLQSAMLGMTRIINGSLQQDTINCTMLFFKTVFADTHLQPVLSGEEFLKEFRMCFQNATQRLEKSHTLEEIRKNIAEKSGIV